MSPDAAVTLAGGQGGLAPGLVPELSSGQVCSAVVCLGLRKAFLSGTLLQLPHGGATLSRAASGRPCCGAFRKGVTHRWHVLSELSLGPLPSLATSSRWVKTRQISVWTWCFCALCSLGNGGRSLTLPSGLSFPLTSWSPEDLDCSRFGQSPDQLAPVFSLTSPPSRCAPDGGGAEPFSPLSAPGQ